MKKNLKFKMFDKGPRLIVIFFMFILIYISAFVISYMTKENVDIHEVEVGSISTNNTYSGIALRDEEIFYSEFAGQINYFVREGERCAVNSVVYTIDETGKVASMIASLNSDNNSMSETNQSIIRNSLSTYKMSNSNNRFYEVYDLKDRLDLVVSDSVNENIIKNLDDMIKDTGSEALFKYSRASKTGLVVYNKDGYENLSIDQLTSDSFNKDAYHKENLRESSTIVSDTPVYKLIKDEAWNIVFPLTNDQITSQRLSERNNVQIRFIKNDIRTNANFRIVPTNGGTYGVLSLNKYMVQFASDRFIDVEIITSSASGLKIPVSSIVEKEFFLIPEEFGASGGNKSTIGFLREHQDNTGKVVTEYTNVDVYALIDGKYYVDKSDFNYGESILLNDRRYSISEVSVLKGAYTVNKGYAVFRRIDVIDQNEEYAVVRTGVKYGLSSYDHIVLDGTKVKENQIIY